MTESTLFIILDKYFIIKHFIKFITTTSIYMFQNFSDIAVKEIAPGFFSKLIHTDDNTINFLEVAAGNELPMHQHPHQQCSFVLEGAFEMTVGEETSVLTSNTFAIIPGNAPHGGKAITNCKLIDIFSPVREDYK